MKEGMESQEESEVAWCNDKGYEGNSRVCSSGGEKLQKKQLEVMGTTKEEIIKGDPKCPELIATSV